MKKSIFLLAAIISLCFPSAYAEEWELKWPTFSKELQQKAKTDMDAYTDLAICYGYGLGVKADKKKCYKMFKDNFGFTVGYNSKLGKLFPYASLWYGIFLWDNSTNSEYLGWKVHGYDQNTIIDHLKSLAINHIGFAAKEGLEDAEMMYARANRGNSKYSCVSIAMWNSDVTPMSLYFGYYQEAKEWYEKACQHGNPTIMLEYAKYLEDIAASVDYNVVEAELAYYWYKTAAEYGSPEAERLYAWYFENGVYENASLSEAAKWYAKAAGHGDTEAAGLAGRAMLQDSTLQDKTLALDFLKKGTEQGDGLAAYLLGKCYETGNYIEQNHKLAFECFNISAEDENIEGLFALGTYYENGYGCDANPKKAAEAYEICADIDSSNILVGRAALKIADMYNKGIGVFMNKEKAQYYYEKAESFNF